MKKLSYLIAFSILAWSIQACNNNPKSKDSVELAEDVNNRDDTANFKTAPEAGMDTTGNFDDTDFAVKAADGGLTEVQLGKIALSNSSDQAVKNFGQMMVDDHTKANNELIALAEKKGIALPPAPSQDKVKHIKELNEKMGNDFDKSYIDMMVTDHEDTIDLFEKASKNATDADIKAFATKTLPVLKKHLTTVQSLKKTHDSKM